MSVAGRSLGWSGGRLVGRSVIISLKVEMLHFHAPIAALVSYLCFLVNGLSDILKIGILDFSRGLETRRPVLIKDWNLMENWPTFRFVS